MRIKKKKKMKVLELIVDWSLWPRYEANDLDVTNINNLKNAIRAGVTLPPIIVDEKSLRIIDGIHRQSAYLGVYGDDAETDVELQEFENDTEMFKEAARLNSRQGLKLSQKDRAHVMLTLRRKRVPWPEIAEVLGMDVEEAKDFMKRRTAMVKGGEKIPLAYGAKNLAGLTLDAEQEKYARTANGMLAIVNARLLMNALKANVFPLTEKEVEVLVELRDVIDSVLGGKKAAAAGNP